MRGGALVLLALLAACSGTDTSPVAGGPEPSGWIYFSVEQHSRDAPLPERINVSTGKTEVIEFPLPYDTTRPWRVYSGNISPPTGQITGLAFVGGSAAENFIYYPVGDSIKVLRFDPGGPFNTTVGFKLVWSPDGKKIVFQQVRINCCAVLALLYPSTGALDTLVGGEAVSNFFFWLGPDTVVFNDGSKQGWAPTSIDIGTHQMAPWTVIDPPDFFRTPIVSSDGRWIAYWTDFDSTGSAGNFQHFWSLHLRDRHRDTDTTLVVDPSNFDGTIFPEAAFEPDNRFLAYCTSRTTVTILDLERRRRAKSFEIPQCMSIAWSWGENGVDSGI